MAWVENVMAGYSQQNNNLLYLLHSQLSVHLHNNSLYHLTKYGNEVGYIAEGPDATSPPSPNNRRWSRETAASLFSVTQSF